MTGPTGNTPHDNVANPQGLPPSSQPHVEINQAPSVSTSGQPYHAAPPRFFKRGLLQAILFASLCVVITYLLATRNNSAVAPAAVTPNEEIKPDQHIKVLLSTQKDLQDEIANLKKERSMLERTGTELRREQAQLQQQIDSLKKQINELTSQLNSIHASLAAHVVLVNGQSVAVALERTGGEQFVVLSNSTGETARLIDAAAFKHGIIRVPSERRLTLDISAQASAGERLSGQLSQRVADLFLKEALRKAKTDDHVVFYDLRRQAYVVGMYDGHDDGRLYYQGFDPDVIELPVERIQAGSAVWGRPRDVFQVTGNVGFFEYAVLSIVNELSNALQEAEFPYISLVVHANVDAPDFSREVTHLQSCLAKSEDDDIQLGGMSFNPDQLWSQEEAQRLSRHETQRTQLTAFAHEIEDFLITRFTKAGVPVLERQRLQTILQERGLASTEPFDSNPQSYGKLACCSHVVLIDVASSSKGNDYRLAARLVDANSGRILWSDVSEEPLDPKIPQDKYLLSSGRLAVINQRAGEYRAKQELSLLIDPPGAGDFKLVTERVAFIETASVAPGHFAVRDLFSRRIYYVPREKFDTSKCGPVRSIEDVPMSNLLRYVAWSIASSVAPSSGRVVRVGENDADISIQRAKQFLKPGDTLRAVRMDTSGVEHTFPGQERDYSSYERPLPFQLTVQQLGESMVHAQIRDATLKVLWSESESLQAGDIAYRPRTTPPLLAVLEPEFINAPDDEQFKLKTRFSARAQRIADNTRQVADQLVTGMRKGMIELGFSVVEPTRESDAKAAGVTHLIRTIAQPRYPEHKYTFETVVATSDTNQTVLQTRYDLRADDVASWQP
jgi:TolB-like protein